MRKSIFLSLFCVIFTLSALLCGIEGYTHSLKAETFNSAVQTGDEAETTRTQTEPTAYAVTRAEPVTLAEGSARVLELTDAQQKTLVDFECSDESTVAVDSGGRIDALKKGTAVVTAVFSDYKKTEFEIKVTDAEKSVYDGFSTCIIANTDVLKNNKAGKSKKDLYEIKVNRKKNCVTVYTYDENGKYTVPVRAMVCSCGENNGTITGNFEIYFKKEWNALYQGVYGHYVSGISGDYLFHSVPYYTPNSDDLEVEEFNKLGTAASLGCVRMAIADTKWIYDNCPSGTKVTIYDDDEAGPLGKPESVKITDKSCGWDPTDNDKKNPYNGKSPSISGAEDCRIEAGGSFEPLDGVTAADTCSNDITGKITVTGNVITTRPGTYKVTYSVTDAMHRTVEKDVTVTVG